MSDQTDLPADIPVPLPAELPELPDGMVWGWEITAEAEVVHPDGTKD